MTKRQASQQSQHSDQNMLVHQGLTPQQQQEQAILLEPFYERLIGMTFNESTTAIERCRDLCAEFGFTVKQEASTHRNIYVYCSREGLPDSLRNPKSNPQRKRPSKRCDCRWRVVLYEVDGHWEFRKSLNPEAGKHNHELMNPDEIERSWPKEVTDLICELARQRMTTQEVRNRVRGQFPNIHWNERRFYNRLSEERQKIKLRDSVGRTHQLNQIWSKLCMASAGNDDLSQLVHQQLTALLQAVTDAIGVDQHSLPDPLVADNNALENYPLSSSSSSNNIDSNINNRITSTESPEQSESSRTPKPSTTSTKNDTAPKGYISVEIPKQTYYIKIHNQRQLQETQLVKNQKRQRQIPDEPTFEPLRRLSQKGKSRQQCVTMTEDNLSPDPLHHHTLAPQLVQHYQRDSRAGSVTVSSLSQQPHQQQATQPHQQQHSQAHQIHPIQHPSGPTFVYQYDNSSMTLDTSMTNYVNPPFQNTYSMNTSPSTPGFNPPDMSFGFDGSHSSLVRNADSNNEPTIHPALQSSPMVHQPKSHHSSPEHNHINTNTIPLHQQGQLSGDHNDSRMYTMTHKSQEQDKHQQEQEQDQQQSQQQQQQQQSQSQQSQPPRQHNDQHEHQIQHEASNQSRMSSIYNTSKDNVSVMQSRNVISSNSPQSYNNQQQQQQQQQQSLFIHHTPSPDSHNHLSRPM